MRRLFHGNFEFEHELAHPGRRLSATLRRLNAELATSWLAVAEEGDFLWTPEPIDERFFEEAARHGLPRVVPATDPQQVQPPVEFCPWGWTEPVRRWAAHHGWRINAPPQTAVRVANSRRLSATLEHEWNAGLPGACVVDSLTALHEAIRFLSGRPWVIKAEFGMSARERILGRGEPPPQSLRWIESRLRADGVFFFEPWVERLSEAGLQFDVSAKGKPRFLGLTPLLCDPSGQYRGSRFTWTSEEERAFAPAIDTGLRVAERLQAIGYFGPLGIDAMQYRDLDGNERLRPIQDLNARWTMGRLSLGFRRLSQPGETGVWLHGGDVPTIPGARVIPTSPQQVGNQPPRHRAAVIINSQWNDVY